MPALLAAHPQALSQAEAVWELEERVRSSVYLTAQVALKGYQDPYVLRTCRPSQPGGLTDITPETVLGTADTPGATLYVISPPTERRYFAPLFSALVASLLDAAFARSEDSGGQLDPPLLVALDEAANIVPIKELPNISSMTAGAGIQLITVLQDLAQAHLNWGDSMWTLVTNHYGGRLILGGTVEPAMLKWAGEMLGEVDRDRRSISRAGLFGKRTKTVSPERQPAATAAEIRTMPRGMALLIAGSYPTARVTLKQWHTV
jgi:type IV secretory pathway TraG/TraD family ATPase VirD4